MHRKTFQSSFKKTFKVACGLFFPPLGVRLDKAVGLIHVGVSFTSDVTPAVLFRGCGGRSFLPCYGTLHWKRPPTGWELRPLWWVISLMTSQSSLRLKAFPISNEFCIFRIFLSKLVILFLIFNLFILCIYLEIYYLFILCIFKRFVNCYIINNTSLLFYI